MTRVIVGLGSNLGDRLAHLRDALRELEAAGITVESRSSLWETAPVPPGQPPFLNAVVVASTALSPLDLLDVLKDIERRMGRTATYRWGPRVVDLDILFYGDDRVDEGERLTVPHPRAAARGFVLAPLAEVFPGELPVLGRTAADFLAAVGADGLERTEFTWL